MRNLRQKIFIAALALVLECGLSAQTGWQSLGNVVRFDQHGSTAEITAQRGKVRITALAPDVVRLTYAPGGKFSDVASFAVLPNTFPGTALKIENRAEALDLSTSALRVHVQKSPLLISFFDASGKALSEERRGYPAAFNGSEFRVWKSMPEDEHYFGLGDKTGPLDHRDLAFSMWNMDMFGWQESTDPLYKDIPFFLALRQGVAYGIYLDNTYRSSFDFGKESRDRYSFSSDGGALDYYLFYGPSPKQVVEDFTQLVGRTPLPPLFTLGFQQCRYSYYPESQVREIAAEFRKRKIPVDVLYLDIDYQQDNRPFTINRDRFPNFEGMVKDLAGQGIKLVLITDLHIAKLPGYKPYDEGIKGGYFVKNPDGSVYIGKVWPGDSVFPDFTRAEVRKWWGTLYTDFVKAGVRGFWNDMNEPSVFFVPSKTMPLDTVHNVEGRVTDHREIHNVFGMQNARATYEGLLRLRPDMRPFVLTRAAFAGTQRYAATWTGDNTASWNHMRLSIPQLANLGVSGYSFAGADIGGFNGSATPDLLTRWMEIGVFNPMYRAHAAKDTRYREPWVDGPEHEAIRKRYIETRYRLLPYIYTGMEESSRTGVPLLRPLFLEFPEDNTLALNGEEFMFGGSLLVAPRVWPFVGTYKVTLPKGEWYDFWTGKSVAGGKVFEVDPPLETLPVYVRGGSILAEQPVVQNVDEEPQGPLQLKVYPGPQCGGDLYADDGSTLAYQRGEKMRLHFTCSEGAGNFEVGISAAEGSYRPWFKALQVTVYGLKGQVGGVAVDGTAVKTWRAEDGAVIISDVAWTPEAHKIKLELSASGVK